MKNLPHAVSWSELRPSAYYGRWPERGPREAGRAVTADEVLVPSCRDGDWYCSLCGMCFDTKAKALACCPLEDVNTFFDTPVFHLSEPERAEVRRLAWLGYTPRMIEEQLHKENYEVAGVFAQVRKQIRRKHGLFTKRAYAKWQRDKRKAQDKQRKKVGRE